MRIGTEEVLPAGQEKEVKDEGEYALHRWCGCEFVMRVGFVRLLVT
jgi:hypothetical protein